MRYPAIHCRAGEELCKAFCLKWGHGAWRDVLGEMRSSAAREGGTIRFPYRLTVKQLCQLCALQFLTVRLPNEISYAQL